MTNFSFLVAIFVILVGSVQKCIATPQVDAPIKDKWALVVGISKFADSSLNLNYPAKDAKDFYNYLTGEGNFDPDHVKLLTDEEATREHILSLLGGKWLPRAARPDDLVVIYISSHGSPSSLDVGGVNYVVAHDTDIENLYATGIPMQDLARMIKGRVHSNRVVVILDACHSGAATPESKGMNIVGNVSVDEIVQGTGQLVISSSEPNQSSWESKEVPNSVFTRYLIEGLKSNGRYTKLSDAFSYMKDKVQNEVLQERGVLQTPVLKSKWEGSDLILAVAPVLPHPAPRDESLSHVARRLNDKESSTKNITRDSSLRMIEVARPTAQPTINDLFSVNGTNDKERTKLESQSHSQDDSSSLRQTNEGDEQSWWSKFHNRESESLSLGAESKKQVFAKAAEDSDTKAGVAIAQGMNQVEGPGYFTVPNWFSVQPKVYDRPTEIFRSPTSLGLTGSQAMDAFKNTLPWITGGGVGYGIWPAPLWTTPGMWGYAGTGAGYWLGALGLPGYGIYGPSYIGSWAWGGVPWGGWWANPASGALWAGAFGNANWSSGLGVVTPGLGVVTPGLGVVTPTAVFQSAPSKAAGNYFLPSTGDPTATGSYYASGTPAQTPVFAPQKPITNFWGSGSNPYAGDTTMPWNK